MAKTCNQERSSTVFRLNSIFTIVLFRRQQIFKRQPEISTHLRRPFYSLARGLADSEYLSSNCRRCLGELMDFTFGSSGHHNHGSRKTVGIRTISIAHHHFWNTTHTNVTLSPAGKRTGIKVPSSAKTCSHNDTGKYSLNSPVTDCTFGSPKYRQTRYWKHTRGISLWNHFQTT